MSSSSSHARGVSLPLVITLIVLLMIAASTAFQLIVRSLNTADNIEDSNRAFFAAEAGIEDALYELSAHRAGYETPNLDSAGVRSAQMSSEGVRWENQWEIKNLEPTGSYTGELYARKKLKVHFFEDTSSEVVDQNAINLAPPAISPVNVSADFTLTFSVPFDEEGAYSNFFDAGTLKIDNDGDLQGDIADLNEDGKDDMADCGDGFISKDGDCDGSQDEDSEEDPVVTCHVYDEDGRSWQPLDGCLSGNNTPEDPKGSEICEKDFQVNALNDNKIEVTWDETVEGKDSENGNTVTLGAFIAPLYEGRLDQTPVTLECLVVAPLIQVDTLNTLGAQKELPYLESSVHSTLQSGNGLPLPTFTLRSDGWYRDFKQSITTQLIPKESVPLLDITIIQQN